MAGILLQWSQFGNFDYFEVYRSESPIDANNLPPPIVTSLDKMFYWDEDVTKNTPYNYRVASVLNGVKMVSENIVYTIKEIAGVIGLWFSAYTSQNDYSSNNQFNPNGEHTPEWLSNFEQVTDFSMIDYRRGGGTSNMSGEIVSAVTGLEFEIAGYAGSFEYDQAMFDIEFLDAAGNSIFALKARNNSYYYTSFMYGNSLAAMTGATSSGNYAQVYGRLVFNSDSVTYTPLDTSNYIEAFTFYCDTSKIEKVIVSNLYAYASPYPAYAYLKCLGRA